MKFNAKHIIEPGANILALFADSYPISFSTHIDATDRDALLRFEQNAAQVLEEVRKAIEALPVTDDEADEVVPINPNFAPLLATVRPA